MLNTIKNFKWFFTISFISILLGLLTFVTFINQKLIFLNEDYLQYLLILDVTVLILFLILLVRETTKLFLKIKSGKEGSKTSLNYVLQFSLFAFIPSLVIAIFSLIFSTFSNFLGRENCYLILALINILYLMFVLSSLGTFSTSFIAIFFDYFTVHIVYLFLLSSLFFKRTKRFLGYEGL